MTYGSVSGASQKCCLDEPRGFSRAAGACDIPHVIVYDLCSVEWLKKLWQEPRNF